MDLSFLSEFINLGILGVCLCIGYVIKTSLDFIPNKYIPLIMLILGTVLGIITNLNDLSINVVLTGMVSGLASTGMYEMFKNLINKESE